MIRIVHLLCATTFITLVTVSLLPLNPAQAFDFAAYKDPISECRLAQDWFTPNAFGNCGVDGWEANVSECNRQALSWFEDLGITHLYVYYADEDYVHLNGSNIKVINAKHPLAGRRYMDAYRRIINLAEWDDTHPYNYDTLNWSAPLTSTSSENVFRRDVSNPVLQIGTNASAGTKFWKALYRQDASFGALNGWKAHGMDSVMQMHFQFRAKLEVDPNDHTPDARIATFYWYVKEGENLWWRYPGIRLDSSDFNPGNEIFDVIQKSIIPDTSDPHWGDFSYFTDTLFVPCDSLLQPVGNWPYGNVKRHAFSSGTHASHGPRVLFEIVYEGHHTLMMHDVDVWDEGYNRLFMAGADTLTWQTQVADAFANQYNAHRDHMLGWYYDEYDETCEQLHSWVKVNQLLQNRGLPTLYLNGHADLLNGQGPRNKLHAVLDSMNVTIPVEMAEFYPFTRSRWCVPDGYWSFTLGSMWADTSSDRPYADCTAADSCDILTGCCGPHPQYSGTKSLQCALDGSIWSWGPTAEPANIDPGPMVIFAHDYDTMGLLHQTRWLHDHGTKMWALIATAGKGIDIPDINNPGNEPREPTPNELKLTAWLAVACDVDGIMWYTGMSAPRHSADEYGWPGFLEWGRDAARIDYSYNFCTPKSIFRTDRYFAAKKVSDDIRKIAPVLEPLQFVKTYASRAFKQNYGTSTSNDSIFLRDRLTGFGSNATCIEYIHTQWQDQSAFWHPESPDSSYVQVSRFMTPGMTGAEKDYWFLIVNRRALATPGRPNESSLGEKRRISIGISNLVGDQYATDFLLTRSSSYVTRDDQINGVSFHTDLLPGDAELVHFSPSSSWTYVDHDTIMKAPLFVRGGITIRNATLTIIPDTANLARTDTIHGVATRIYDSVATVTFISNSSDQMDKGIYLDGHSSANLRILGTTQTRIRLQSSNSDNPSGKWFGIWRYAESNGAIEMRNAIMQDATNGLFCNVMYQTQTPVDTSDVLIVDSCEFRRCGTAISVMNNGPVRISNTNFFNNSVGFDAENNLKTVLSDCRFESNYGNGIQLIGSTANLAGVSIRENSQAGLWLLSSSAKLKCCDISNNSGPGIYTVRKSTIVMADPSHPLQSWGYNTISMNDTSHHGYQVYEVDAATFILNKGFNTIRGDATDGLWFYHHNANCSEVWRDNYWGLTDSALIYSHLPSNVTYAPFQYGSVACGGILNPDTSLEDTPINKMAQGVVEQGLHNYTSARELFVDAVSNAASCRIGASAVREVLNTDILSNDPGASKDYFRQIADSVINSNRTLSLSARSAQAWSLALSGNLISAVSTMQMLLDSARNDTEIVDAKIDMLTLDLYIRNMDSSQVVTPEDVQQVSDSIRYLIASLSRWTQYTILDSIVMYAPCRVDSPIFIPVGGTLVIKPQPGIHPAQVTFGPAGALQPNGWPDQFRDPNLPRGRLIVEGASDNPVILNWDERPDNVPYGNIDNNCGEVDLKHTIMTGNGWCMYNVNPYSPSGAPRRPIFRADSCVFRQFDTGLYCEDTDSASYLHNCLLESLNPPSNWSFEYGPSLLIVGGAYLDVQNCEIRNAGEVGVFGAWVSGADFHTTTITGSHNYGVLNWETSQLSFECCEISNNGDSLAEICVEDGNVSLVGGHNIIADSSGTLIYAANPAMVDLSDGENQLEFNGSAGTAGTYLKSGTTTATWDVALNNWSPVTPADTTFYSHLYPSNPSKWLVDTSLVSFVACGESSTSSFNPNSLIILGQRNQDRTGDGLDEYDPGNPIPDKSQMQATKSVAVSHQKKATDEAMKRTKGIEAHKVADHAQVMRQYHSELAQWRSVEDAVKAGNSQSAKQTAMAFVREHPASDRLTSAMVKLVSMTNAADADHVISTFLAEQSNHFAHSDQRLLAKRLSSMALAKEGDPSQALSQLEAMMETAPTPRDSVKALIDAMGVYFTGNHSGSLQPRFAQVRCDNAVQLGKRMYTLAKLAQNPSLLEKERPAAVPASYCLYQNFPNPFNPNTEIRFDLPEAVRVELKVFNVLGQEVAKLVDQVKPAGAYRITWDSKGASGIPVASGMYIYQIKAGEFTDAKKMMLIR